MHTILIADDEKNIRDGLAYFITTEGYEAVTATDGEVALEKARALAIDCALIDLRMPKIQGAQLLAKLVSEQPLLPVIIITGHGTVENAVAAMQNGAYDFITKPVDLNRLGALLKRALENRRTVIDNELLRNEIRARNSERSITSVSPAMQRVMKVAKQVAGSDATILITGESGVGKEVLADFIHEQSPRQRASMIKVHCASLNDSLLESELFGHERGAFTGATSQRKGRFELADHGTIFLDEIGEINQTLQVKILRVLQQRQFERVGGEKTLSVDVRIIAATNRDLNQEMIAGRFREDLYYRLNVVRIEIPPLRERREELPRLISQFLHEFSGQNGTEISKRFSEEAQRMLLTYNWPGNIRELRNCVESSVILSNNTIIESEHLPDTIARNISNASSATPIAADPKKNTAEIEEQKTPTAPTINNNALLSIPIPATASLAEAERIIIAHALENTHGNKSKTAHQLGIQRVTLYEKIKKYNL